MTEDDEISPAPPLHAGADARPPPSRHEQAPFPSSPHADGLQRRGTDDSAVRDGKADGKSVKGGKGGHGFGGLKRLSTIMGRRKSSAHPPLPLRDDADAPLPPPAQPHGHLGVHGGGTETLGKKAKRTSFMPFRRNNDSAKQGAQAADSPLHPHRRSSSVTSGEEQHEQRLHEVAQGQHLGEQRDTSGSHAAQDSILELPEPGEGHRNWSQSQYNRQTDAEGFTVRTHTEDEITRLQREAAAAHLEEEHAIRIRDQKIEEDENAAQQAMTQMANTLRMQAQQSGLRGSGTLRGRREARNAVGSSSSGNLPPDPPAHAHGRPNLAVNIDGRMSGISTHSPTSPNTVQMQPHSPHPSHLARPPRTMASLSSEHESVSGYSTVRRKRPSVFVHAETSAPGLAVSLVECLTSRVTEGKVVSSLVGELAFANNASEKQQDVKIRIDNHATTDKIAANTALVTDTQVAGEYILHLPRLLRLNPQVAFKQSVQLTQDQLDAHTPVLFKPTWHLQDFQASVIIKYVANPAFTPTIPNTKITLTNVRVTVHLDTTPSPDNSSQPPARAASAITHPTDGARFNPRKSAVTWSIASLDIPAHGGEEKLLARFGCSTPGPKAGHVDVSFDYVAELGAEAASPRLGVSVFDEEGRRAERDPFADETDDDATIEDPWRRVPVRWTLRAVKFVVA